MKLSARIRRNAGAAEFATGERCYITELWSIADEPGLTVAIARVEPGVSTQLHALEGGRRALRDSGRNRPDGGG